jgi:hypothetical protein
MGGRQRSEISVAGHTGQQNTSIASAAIDHFRI